LARWESHINSHMNIIPSWTSAEVRFSAACDYLHDNNFMLCFAFVCADLKQKYLKIIQAFCLLD